MSATAGLLAAGALCAAEGVLRRQNPHRLWSSAFNEGSVTQPHPIRGWTRGLIRSLYLRIVI